MKKIVMLLVLFIACSAYAQQTEQTISTEALISQDSQDESMPLSEEIQDSSQLNSPLQQQNVAKEEATEKGQTKEQDNAVHPYIRFDVGLTYTTFEINNNTMSGFQELFNFGAGIKYKKSRFEFVYQPRETMSDILFIFADTYCSIGSTAYMFNYFYNFLPHFYIGAGAGLNDWESTFKPIGKAAVDSSGQSFIGGLYLGASVDVPLNLFVLSIDFGLDYYYTDDPLMNSIVPKIGARFTF